MINKKTIDEIIELSTFIGDGIDEGSLTKNNYKVITSPRIDIFKKNNDKITPNLIFQKELNSIKNNSIKNIISKSFNYWGRTIKPYVWATLFFENKSIKEAYRVSFQLYISAGKDGIRFGLCLGDDVENDSEFVRIIQEDSTINQKLYSIIASNPNIKVYDSENKEIKVVSGANLGSLWSKKHQVLGKFKKDEIPDNAGEIIQNVLTQLAEVFNDIILKTTSDEGIDNNPKTEMENLKEVGEGGSKPLNKILYGPPGTGKTFNTINESLKIIAPDFYMNNKGDRTKLNIRFKELLIKGKDWDNTNGQIAFCTFHQSFSYEDFVEGIKPKTNENKEVYYKIEDGIFKNICRLAKENINKKYVLIIDEINRGNVSSIFGELITLIEKDKRADGDEELEVTLPYSKTPFKVPGNLYIVGTMNTADRSIEALDTALRRRFVFDEKPPKPELILSEGISGKKNGMVEGRINLKNLLETINNRIEKLIDKDHKIGHSYFLKVHDEPSLKHCFKNEIIPLLEEYFFGDYGKIGLVLGDSFVKEDKKVFDFAEFKGYDDDVRSDLKARPVYKIRPSGKWNFDSI